MKAQTINWVHVGIALAVGIVLTTLTIGLSNQIRPAPIQILPPPTATPLLPTSTPEPLSIYVNGAVNQPGVYELPFGSRLTDAVAVAGGFSAEAASDLVNLAAPLHDGVQVFVPGVGDSAEVATQLLLQHTQVTTADPSSSGTGTLNGKVNLNTATRAELDMLPGVGEATAQKIVTYREDNGRFKMIDDIMNVPGIGEAKFEQMRELIEVDEP